MEEAALRTIPECRVSLDDSGTSEQVRAFMEELEEAMPKVHIYYEETGVSGSREKSAGGEAEAAGSPIVPAISISSKDGGENGDVFSRDAGRSRIFQLFVNTLSGCGTGETIDG